MPLSSHLWIRTSGKVLIFHLGLLDAAQHAFSWEFYFPLDPQYLLLTSPQDWWLPHLLWGSLSLGSLLWPESSRDASFWLRHVSFHLSGVTSLTFQIPFGIPGQSPAPPTWSPVTCQLVTFVLWSGAVLYWPLFPVGSTAKPCLCYHLHLKHHVLPVLDPQTGPCWDFKTWTGVILMASIGLQSNLESHLEGKTSNKFCFFN